MPGTNILSKLNLDGGSHEDPNKGVCVMEVAHLAMAGRWVNGRWVLPEGVDLTDLPACTHEGIARVAQRLWDRTADADGDLTAVLAKFLPRLMRAKRTDNRRVQVRIALATARFVEHLAGPEAKPCNDTVQAWLDGEATTDDVQKASAAANASASTYATYAAAYAASTSTYATYAYAATYAAAHAAALEPLLDHLLTAHEKACAEEGEAVWDPQPWEQDAIDFVDRLMAEIGAAPHE